MKLEKQFLEVVQLIKQAQSNAYKAINIELINCNWQVGEYISRRTKETVWGEKTINELAKFIEKRHPELKGFGLRNLYRMKQFYETYRGSAIVSPAVRQILNTDNQHLAIVSPVVSQIEVADIRASILAGISWTNHLIILARTKTMEEKEFYIRLCIQENYGKRELERQISRSATAILKQTSSFFTGPCNVWCFLS